MRLMELIDPLSECIFKGYKCNNLHVLVKSLNIFCSGAYYSFTFYILKYH